jgi:hypothetical protein
MSIAQTALMALSRQKRRGGAQFDPPAALQNLRDILAQWYRLPGGA